MDSKNTNTTIIPWRYNYFLDAKFRSESLAILRSDIGKKTGDASLHLAYLPLELIVSAFDRRQEYANILLQIHRYRDCQGKWCDELLKYGYVMTTTHIGICPHYKIEKSYTKELVSPHGRIFFKRFFELANSTIG